jgi:ADP-ribose pyrophosphatase YjhB (NUDIX family)
VGKWYARSLDLPSETVRERLNTDEFGHITPKVGAAAAVFDEEGRILLIQQPSEYTHGGGAWTLPGGYSDSGEAPEETAIRETHEETTLEVRPGNVFSVAYSEPPQNGPHGGVIIGYLCEVIDGNPEPSHESQAVRYWEIDEVPAWYNNAEQGARDAYEAWNSETDNPGR